MNCSFCGKELKAGAKFCAFCGTRAPSEQPKNIVGEYTPPIKQETAYETPESVETVEKTSAEAPISKETALDVNETVNSYKAEEPAKELEIEQESVQADGGAEKKPVRAKNKKKIVVALVAVFVALAVIIAALAVSFTVFFAPKTANTPVGAYTYNGGACICYGNGKMINLKGNITEAYLTPDEERIVCINNGKTVCYLTTGKSDIREIFTVGGDKELHIISVSNDMIWFATDECLYRFVFERSEFSTVIDKVDVLNTAVLSSSGYLSADESAVAYVRNNVIFVMTPKNGIERSITGVSADATVRIHDVSCDGEAILWSEYSNSQGRVSTLSA